MNTWPNKLLACARQVSFLFLLALVCWPINTAAQKKEEQKGESTISGRVIFADTGRPVRRATVQLFTGLNYAPVRITVANARGEFRFNEVQAGSYFVVAEEFPGIASKAMAITEFGLTTDTETEHTRVTVDGKGATRCEVRVMRGGTIKGTILYADKEPVTSAQIMLFRRWNNGTVPLVMEPVQTNDRGMYRIDGLPNGEYFVAVVDGRQKFRLSNERELRGFVTAYYPGVLSIVEAKPVQIQSGSEVTGINVTFGDDELRHISGVVKARNDAQRVLRASVSLRRKDEPRVEVSIDNVTRSITPPDSDRGLSGIRHMGLVMVTMPPTKEANKDGTWRFEDLAPGTYVLTVDGSLAPKQKPVKNEEDELGIDELVDDYTTASAQREFTLKDEDLTDVVVELFEGTKISGSIVTQESPLPPVRIYVHHEAADLPWFVPSLAEANGTFIVQSIPKGEVRLDVNVSWESDLYVKSITLGSQDLMRNSLRVEEGVDINGVQIILEKGLATFGGRVLFSEGGDLAGGSGVLLVRADESLWRLSGSRVFVAANAEGEFELKCPPGDYLVFTWPAGNHPYQSLDEFVKSQAPNAKRISLRSRDEKRMDLTVAKPKR